MPCFCLGNRVREVILMANGYSTSTPVYTSTSYNASPSSSSIPKKAAAPSSGGIDWNKLIQEIYQGIQGYQDPYLGQLETLTQRWLDPNYQAYSPERLQEWYEQGKSQLEGDIFKEWDENYGRSMVAQGLTGSGVGNLAYGKILGQKGGALADLWGGLQQFAEQARRADIERATTLLPMMSQLRNLPTEQRFQLLDILTADRTGERSQKASNAAGAGAAIASVINSVINAISRI